MRPGSSLNLENMTKWDWIAMLVICVGFALMVLGAIVFRSVFVVIPGLLVLITGVAVGTFLSDWDPRFWV
jgi:hypothetical protein